MFRLINSRLHAYSFHVKSQDAVHTLGSQFVYISEIFKPYHLPRRVKLAKCVTDWLKYILKILMCVQQPVTEPVKNRPEDGYLLVETCSLHITLCNKNSCADVQISIAICSQLFLDVFIQKSSRTFLPKSLLLLFDTLLFYFVYVD